MVCVLVVDAVIDEIEVEISCPVPLIANARMRNFSVFPFDVRSRRRRVRD
jgi:hypothetical protein